MKDATPGRFASDRYVPNGAVPAHRRNEYRGSSEYQAQTEQLAIQAAHSIKLGDANPPQITLILDGDAYRTACNGTYWPWPQQLG